ncbi:sensor domain-containing diguanylate cyclase [Aliikangiella marina]|uniref:Sensor domain-containing diguanylate cyclase n=1 Tax=Aliikangiella marina TaxID=1712262 RepID=A0A545T0Y0_9GAMM|nr:sensor domain-containing diguanylate cyclase [Aliikangiella marina]TQV70875.1 sensor domain-containing diguanylate cyclase [Aliikangiella marina]
MESPLLPENEKQRLAALRTLQILDTDPEERFDRITRMAKRLFGVSICLVSLVDKERQWFKSKQGLDACETHRDISFCGHAILDEALFVIEDAREDKRFFDNPLVTGEPKIRFYAGCPLKTHNGFNIGTLCLIDQRPRKMDEEDRQLLKDLGAMVEKEFTAIQMATLDSVTLISNRRGFMSLAEHTLNVCRRKDLRSSLVLFEIVDFHKLNETHGEALGQRVLKCFAQGMESVFRESDIFARLTAGEFAVLLTDSAPDDIESIIQRFNEKLTELRPNFEISTPIDFKHSVAHFPSDTNVSAEEMVEIALKSMP